MLLEGALDVWHPEAVVFQYKLQTKAGVVVYGCKLKLSTTPYCMYIYIYTYMQEKHLLEAHHPSPYSAQSGLFKSGIFSSALKRLSTPTRR